MECEKCQKHDVNPIRLYGPPNLCRRCREQAVVPAALGADDVRWGMCHLPSRYRVLEPASPVLAKISKYVDEAWTRDVGILVEGPVGCGKTLLVSSLVHRLMARGANCLFVSVPETVDALRSQESPISIERMKSVQHLVLDDLGAEYDKSGWWYSILYQIVNDRYNNGKPTSATCNVFKQIEPRIMRRIAEQAYIVSMEKK